MELNDNLSPSVYRCSRGWRILNLTLGIALTVFMILCMIIPFTLEKRSVGTFIFFFLPGGGMILFIIYVIVSTFKSYFEARADRLIESGVFTRRELLFSEIKGFRKVQSGYNNE